MLQVLIAQTIAAERERDIQRQVREQTLRREAAVAIADAAARVAAIESRTASADRLCPDCPCRLAAPAL